jgi:hypothetical protein
MNRSRLRPFARISWAVTLVWALSVPLSAGQATDTADRVATGAIRGRLSTR